MSRQLPHVLVTARMSQLTFACKLLAVAALLSACAADSQKRRTIEDTDYRVDYWEMNKENCEDVLRDPYAFDLPRVLQCTQLWETYREVSALSVDVRSMYAVGFSRLFHESKGYAQIVAKAALNRVCVPAHPLSLSGKVTEKVPQLLDCGDGSPFVSRGQQPVSPEQQIKTAINKRIAPDVEEAVKLSKRRGLLDVKSAKSVGKGQLQKATLLYGECMLQYQASAYAVAIRKCEAALQIHPYYIEAKYLLAHIYTAIGENEVAITHLTELYMWSSPQVTHQLLIAKVDPGLKNLRDDLRFKVMTNYRRTTLLNGSGDADKPEIERLLIELTAKGYDLGEAPSIRIGNDKNIRLYPTIYYRPIFQEEAKRLKVIVGSEQTRLAAITWESRDDLIIAWGSTAGAAMFAANSQAAPIPQGTPAKELEEVSEDPLGDALGKAEELKGKAADTKAAGEGLAAPP
jgi:tetratricopeptide (TPR) repeat protein